MTSFTRMEADKLGVFFFYFDLKFRYEKAHNMLLFFGTSLAIDTVLLGCLTKLG